MWNPESTDVESRIHRRGIDGIHSVESGNDPRLSWITLHGANDPRLSWITLHGANFSILFLVFFSPYF